MDNVNGLQDSREQRKVEVLQLGLKNSQVVIQEFANCLERKNKEISALKDLVKIAFKEGYNVAHLQELEEAWENSLSKEALP